MGSSSSLSNCAEGKTPKNPWVKKWWGGDDDSIGQYTVASSFSHHFHILHLEDKSSERSCMILLANDKNGPNFPTKQRCAEDNIVFPFVVYWAARWHFSSVSIEDGQRLSQHVSWDGWTCFAYTRPGKLTKSYWKWSCRNSWWLPINCMGGFSIVMLVYQRVVTMVLPQM